MIGEKKMDSVISIKRRDIVRISVGRSIGSLTELPRRILC